MENVIIYGVIVVAVIINIVRTYQKEAQKNKERAATQPVRPTVSSSPAPFSRRQSVEETYTTPEYQSIESVQPVVEYTFANEGVSAIQQHIDRQEKSDEKNNERLSIIEDSKVESFDLKLDTTEDFKRAFVHSLIFERKY